MLLIKFKGDWADEMDIYGFHVMSKEQWEFKKNEIKHTPFPQDLQIGSNQYETYETYENYMKNFKVIEITKTEAEIINRLFGSYYGKFAIIEGEAPKEFHEKYGYYPKNKEI